MIVVSIIALLAAIAVPVYLHYKRNARDAAFINDLRVAAHAFETYASTKGRWPPDGINGIPAQMDDYLPAEKWDGPTPLGGVWDWDYNQYGFKAGISVHNPTADDDEFTRIDEKIDDGNLSTGQFRKHGGGFIFILEF